MKAVITIPFDDGIEAFFEPEDKVISRAKYFIRRSGDDIEFVFEADDAAALRTVINAVLKQLSIWGDMP